MTERKQVLAPDKPKRGRPRLENARQTNEARKPWEHSDPPMSRRTWYRRQSEKAG